MSTQGKTITILGATSSLGQALAYAFASSECTLILLARQVERLIPLQKDLQLRKEVDSVVLQEFDALQIDEDLLRSVAQKTDLLISTIGYLGDQPRALRSASERRLILQTNFNGVVEAISIFAEIMEKQGKGGIIGISSVAGERGRQSNFYYGSAKAGFTAFLDGLRHHLFPKGIHVMTVLPGFMDTQMTADLDLPKALTASPEQAARKIHRAWRRRKNRVFVLPVWRYIMWVIRQIPEMIFKRTQL